MGDLRRASHAATALGVGRTVPVERRPPGHRMRMTWKAFGAAGDCVVEHNTTAHCCGRTNHAPGSKRSRRSGAVRVLNTRFCARLMRCSVFMEVLQTRAVRSCAPATIWWPSGDQLRHSTRWAWTPTTALSVMLAPSHTRTVLSY